LTTDPAAELLPVTRTEMSFVIPAYNEEECIGAVLEELVQVIDRNRYEAEVIVVDDGSTDHTAAVVESVADRDGRVRLIGSRRNQGKSHAVQAGLDVVAGNIVFLMDADGQDDPSEIPAMLDAVDGGLDLVTGRRAVRRDRLVKRATSRFYNWTTRRLTGVDGRDFNSGFKAMRAEVAASLNLYGDLHRYIPVLAAWSGFRVGEVPVNHRSRLAGASKFGRARFWRGYLDLLTVKFLTTYTNRPLHLLGSIGTVLSGLGLAILVYLSVEWLFGHAIGTRPALNAGILLVIVGIQLISLGLVAELIVSLARRANANGRHSGGSDVLDGRRQ
jgi:glycosyltransferase involved in cell wall biosynthesis